MSNFESYIEAKVIAALKAAASSAAVLSFSELDAERNAPQIGVDVQPRRSIGGGPSLPFYDVPLEITVAVVNGADHDRTVMKSLYGIVADYLENVKRNPSMLNDATYTEYTVDGVVTTESAPQPPADPHFSGRRQVVTLKCCYSHPITTP